jgi:tetratricopeptide (TPR) repeat protein
MRLIIGGLLLVCTSTLSAQSNPSPSQAADSPTYLNPSTRLLLSLPAGPVAPTPPPGGPVSARQLAVPRKAVKELERGASAYQAFELQSAVAHLQTAIRIYPPFMQAHNNLGAAYIDLHEYELAANEFRQAIALDAGAAQPYNNLALTLFLLKRYPEAEAAARRALDLNPTAASVRATLGRTLIAQNQNTAEAVDLLRQASAELPDARLSLAQVLIQRCSLDEAAVELRAYLQNSDPATKQTAELWLAQTASPAKRSQCSSLWTGRRP